MNLRTLWRSLCLMGLCAMQLGCTTVDYYRQAVVGQMQILHARQPIETLLTQAQAQPQVQPQAEPQRAARLRLALEAREFASTTLGLPRNRSYTLYADVGRPYVVWNVFAAPELSLRAVTHCFPVAGCVAYRGYYAKADAEAEGERLKAQGNEVEIGGVAAYSTLGWFDDPILSTMMAWDDDQLDGTIFHELAHQQLYVKGDTAFNESFASFVEQQGLQAWHAAGHAGPADGEVRAQRARQFTQLILETRQRLETIYRSAESDEQKRQQKQAEFERLQRDYAQLRDGAWAGYKGYDRFFERPLNNARLLPFGLYDQWIPAFAQLYREAGKQWPAFYKAARTLGDLPFDQRQQRLNELVDLNRASSSGTKPNAN